MASTGTVAFWGGDASSWLADEYAVELYSLRLEAENLINLENKHAARYAQ